MSRFREAILAARDAFAKLPKHRREELDARFEAAQAQARWHANYRRNG